MFNFLNRKGVALFLVLTMLLVVVILANVVLSLVLSQARLTHHQASRIQAKYAAMAGVNYALEQLRNGSWAYTPVNSCPDAAGCLLSLADFPSSIGEIKIILCPQGTTCAGTTSPCNPPAGYNFCINSTTTYTYTQ